MTARVLLVHDDIATIASVRRLLTRAGYEVALATSAADALVAFGHQRPDLLILSPAVEGGRGKLVLDELSLHPERGDVRVVLLGGELAGLDLPTLPIPLDGKHLLDTVEKALEADPSSAAEGPEPADVETSGAQDAGDRLLRAADELFEATHREIEAEAVASVDAALDAAWSPDSVQRSPNGAVDWSTPPDRGALEAEVDSFERDVLEAAGAQREPDPSDEAERAALARRQADAAVREELERAAKLRGATRNAPDESWLEELAARPARSARSRTGAATSTERNGQPEPPVASPVVEAATEVADPAFPTAADEPEIASASDVTGEDESAGGDVGSEDEVIGQGLAVAPAAAEPQSPARKPPERAERSRPPPPETKFAPSGVASLEHLARLVLGLADDPGPVRLDLRAEGVLRTIWFERGALLAAESTLPHESLVERARRDGLIDSRQHSELRLMRGTSAAQLLQLLRERGYIREHEVVPLVQRYTEQVALEAFGEASSDYRATPERPGANVAAAAVTRRIPEIVLEGLRRSVDGAQQLADLGGLAAVPSIARGAEVRVSSLQLGEREERFLALLDGESTVEDLLLVAGLRQDGALSLLAALLALGWVDVRPPHVEPQPAPPPTLELERLDAKFRQVQEADYFSILGISRAAGGDEVQRAYSLLSAEFDALKYAGHPDAHVHHRVREVQAALAEAAHVLSNDRLRSSYSRHLVD